MSTPPTVHNSDRKAAEEISKSVTLLTGKVYHGLPHIASLAIARHHAEERAAVKKLKTAMKDMRATAYALAGDDSHKILNDSEKLYHAALTALRTASARTSSQSPTD